MSVIWAAAGHAPDQVEQQIDVTVAQRDERELDALPLALMGLLTVEVEHLEKSRVILGGEEAADRDLDVRPRRPGVARGAGP